MTSFVVVVVYINKGLLFYYYYIFIFIIISIITINFIFVFNFILIFILIIIMILDPFSQLRVACVGGGRLPYSNGRTLYGP